MYIYISLCLRLVASTHRATTRIRSLARSSRGGGKDSLFLPTPLSRGTLSRPSRATLSLPHVASFHDGVLSFLSLFFLSFRLALPTNSFTLYKQTRARAHARVARAMECMGARVRARARISLRTCAYVTTVHLFFFTDSPNVVHPRQRDQISPLPSSRNPRPPPYLSLSHARSRYAH